MRIWHYPKNSYQEIPDCMNNLIQSLNVGNERRWQKMLRTVVNCVALRRKCDGHVGKFLNDNYQHWTQKKRNHITAQCTYNKKNLREVVCDVTNLMKPNMSHFNPHLFTIRKLYDSSNPNWWERECTFSFFYSFLAWYFTFLTLHVTCLFWPPPPCLIFSGFHYTR